MLVVALAAILAGAVEDHTQDSGVDELELAHGLGKHDPVAVVLANHQQHAVCLLGNGHSVTDLAHRRQVDDDVIELLAQNLQQLFHSGRAQQLDGIGGILACGDDVEGFPIVSEITVLQNIHQFTLAGQQVGQAGILLEVHFFRQGGAAHIAVDQNNLLIQLGQGIGQVDGGQALALAAEGAGNADDAAVVFIGEGELQFGAQQLVSLGSGKADAVTHEHGLLGRLLAGSVISALFLSGGLAAVAIVVGAALAGGRHIRDRGQDGMFAALGHILLGADGDVKNFTQSNQAYRHHKTQQESDNGILNIAGGTGRAGNHRSLHNLGRGTVDDGTDPLGKNVGNGVGDLLCLIGIGACNGNLKNLGFINRSGSNHISDFPVGAVDAGIVDHIIERLSGVQNDDVRVNQISGGRQVTGGDAEGRIANGQGAVVDIELGRCFILGGNEEECSRKGNYHTQNGYNCDHPCAIQDSAQNPAKVDFYLIIFLKGIFVHRFLQICICQSGGIFSALFLS